MNNWNLTGNLGQDAEVKVVGSGTTLCEFSVAVKSGYGDKEKTNWVRCVMFGKKAEGALPEYLVKGTSVAVSGELSLETWDNNGKSGAALSVNVQNIDLIGGKPQQAQQPQQQQQYQQQQYQQQQYQQPQQQPQQPQQPQQQPQQPQQYAQQQQGVPQQNFQQAPQHQGQ